MGGIIGALFGKPKEPSPPPPPPPPQQSEEEAAKERRRMQRRRGLNFNIVGGKVLGPSTDQGQGTTLGG